MSESSGRESRHLQQQHKLAKDLIRTARAGDAAALARLRGAFPGRERFRLADAQLLIAREAGFESWTKLVRHVEQQELWAAAAALHGGNAAELRRLLAGSEFLRSKINAPLADFGRRAIHFAAKDLAMVEVLLEFGADPNQKSDWHNGPYSPMDEATEETARFMMNHGATLSSNVAARLGWMEELRALLDADPAQVHARGGDGKTPLHEAKNVAIANLLLERGAKVDVPCIDHGGTPAQYALMDRPEVCRRLLASGARPDVFIAARLGDLTLAGRLIDADPSCVAARVNLDGYEPVPRMHIYCWTVGWYRSPRLTAMEAGQAEMAELFRSRSDDRTLLLDAIWQADASECDAIVSRSPGLTKNVSTGDHRMFSHMTHFDKRDSFKLMLGLGFDPMTPGHDGGSALHHACWVGAADLVEMILKLGRFDLSQHDPSYHSTPLGWAAYGSVHCTYGKGGYARVVELLLAAGASIDVLLSDAKVESVSQIAASSAVMAVLAAAANRK